MSPEILLGDPLAPAPARAPWLVTLADLALLLLGFMVLVQASTNRDAVARSLRERFGTVEAVVPIAATAIGFAPGSAAAGDTAPLVAWARDALADPRVTVTVTGSVARDEGGGEGGVLLAADRARVVTAALAAAGLPTDRLQLATSSAAGRRATLTLAFVGETRSQK